MTFAVSFSQLLLFTVFAVAGIAKLADQAGTRRAIEAFGVGPRLAPISALLLPVAELAIAVLLLTASAPWGGAAAVLILLVFSAAIARSLHRGSTPDCNCFGGLSQTEVGRGTLLRNLILAVLAALVAVSIEGKAVGAFRWITVPAPQDRAAIVLMTGALAGLGWFCWQLLRQNGRLLVRLEAENPTTGPAGATPMPPPLRVGSAAPRFSGIDLAGEPITLDSLLRLGRPVALVFTDPGCSACAAALKVVARAQRERADELTLAVVSSGRIDRIEAKAAELGLDRVVPQRDDALFEAYRVNGVPGIVEIDQTGGISKPASLGADAITEVIFGTPRTPLDEPLELAVG